VYGGLFVGKGKGKEEKEEGRDEEGIQGRERVG